jgi:hypothetical protein
MLLLLMLNLCNGRGVPPQSINIGGLFAKVGSDGALREFAVQTALQAVVSVAALLLVVVSFW